MNDFIIKQNDTSPAIIAILQDYEGNPVNLAGASINFHLSNYPRNSVVVDSSAEVVKASEGKVRYKWQDGDTSTSGKFKGEFEVTYADETVETFPNEGFLEIYITPEIA